MPMKWTPENDQLLLLKILETHDMTVNTAKVSAAWPTKDGQDKPTARAISERIVKIKSAVKTNGGNGTAKEAASKTSTPRKRNNGNATTPASKRARKNSDDSTKAGKTESSAIAKEEQENTEIVTKQEPEDVFGSRVRTPAPVPFGMVRYTDDTDDEVDKYETTDSEYVPPAFDMRTANGATEDYA